MSWVHSWGRERLWPALLPCWLHDRARSPQREGGACRILCLLLSHPGSCPFGGEELPLEGLDVGLSLLLPAQGREVPGVPVSADPCPLLLLHPGRWHAQERSPPPQGTCTCTSPLEQSPLWCRSVRCAFDLCMADPELCLLGIPPSSFASSSAGAKCEAGTAEVVGCGPGMLEGARNWALLPLLPAAKVSSEPGSSCLFSALLESEVI